VSEQPLDSKAFLGIIKRRRFAVGAVAVVGLSAGLALGVLRPPMPTARALVILPPTALTGTGTPVRDMQTEVIIATSTPVLAAAGSSVSPPISPTELKHDVAVTAISQDVLQIQAGAAGADEAVRLTNAIATDYIAYATRTSGSSGAAVSSLQQQSSALTQQIQDLQKQINAASSQLASEGATSPAGQRDGSLLESLHTEQEQVAIQLNNVNSDIVSAQASATLAAGATKVLQQAAVVPPSQTRNAELALSGAMAGLLAGSIFAVVRARKDHRLRLRDEVAGAVGIPVLASIEGWRCKTTKEWSKLLQQHRPSPVDVWSTRRVLYHLARSEPDDFRSLNIVAFAGDQPAAAAGAVFASSAAAAGMPSRLVPASEPALAMLRSACALDGKPDAGDLSFSFGTEDGTTDRSHASLAVSIATVDGAKPEWPVTTGPNLLAVSSGFATPEQLAAVALAASDSGRPLDGLILVNPDPRDGTTGAVANDRSAPPVRRRPPRLLSTRFPV
jgi:hypothetical protein